MREARALEERFIVKWVAQARARSRGARGARGSAGGALGSGSAAAHGALLAQE